MRVLQCSYLLWQDKDISPERLLEKQEALKRSDVLNLLKLVLSLP
jgi:hypothetical protein